MADKLAWVAVSGLGVGVICLVLAYSLGGRDLNRLVERGLSLADSCGDGAGKPSQRHLAWDGGDAIDIALSATVRYRGGEGSDLIARGSPDALAHLGVEGGRIVLACRPARGSRDIEITLPGRAFRRIGLSGSGNLFMENVNQPDLALSISGSADVHAQGAIDRMTVTIAGSGRAKLADLTVKELTVKISGSGNIEAAPKDAAEITIAGSGNVRLLSHPARLVSHIAGSGRITQASQ